jgi:hypothetical protein
MIYHAYHGPYDLWLMLDPADVNYSECWAKTSRTESIAQQPARRNIGLFPDQPWFETRAKSWADGVMELRRRVNALVWVARLDLALIGHDNGVR